MSWLFGSRSDAPAPAPAPAELPVSQTNLEALLAEYKNPETSFERKQQIRTQLQKYTEISSSTLARMRNTWPNGRYLDKASLEEAREILKSSLYGGARKSRRSRSRPHRKSHRRHRKSHRKTRKN